MATRKNRHSNRSMHRRATAVTELAVILPVIALVVFSTIETCSMLFLKQALRISAYEGARVSLVPGATMENVQAGCDQILSTRKVKNAVVTVTPTNFSSQPYGTIVKVKVTADCASNSMFVPWIFTGRTLEGEMHMMLER